MKFEKFWKVTGEPAFESLVKEFGECYRLTIRGSIRSDHEVIRISRTSSRQSTLTAHFVRYADEKPGNIKYELVIKNSILAAVRALMESCRFWKLEPDEQMKAQCRDGRMRTFEAWHRGQLKVVRRHEPNPLLYPGELFGALTTYMEWLGHYAYVMCDLELRKRYGHLDPDTTNATDEAPKFISV